MKKITINEKRKRALFNLDAERHQLHKTLDQKEGGENFIAIAESIQIFLVRIVILCVNVCVCVCVKEIERKKEREHLCYGN